MVSKSMMKEIISAIWAIVSLLAYQNKVMWLCWIGGIKSYLSAAANFDAAYVEKLRLDEKNKKRSDAK